MKCPAALSALILLAGCHSSPAQNAADQLDNAAAQSDPAAAATLENAADDMRDDFHGNVADATQNAMSAAGAAQAGSAGDTARIDSNPPRKPQEH